MASTLIPPLTFSYTDTLASTVESEAEASDILNPHIVLCDFVLGLRGLSLSESPKHLEERMHDFCASLKANPLSSSEKLTLKEQLSGMLALLEKLGIKHTFRPNCLIESSKHISLTYVFMALGDVELFDVLLNFGARIPEVHPDISPELMKKYRELQNTLDKIMSRFDNVELFMSNFYPRRALEQKKHLEIFQALAKFLGKMIPQQRALVQQIMQNPSFKLQPTCPTQDYANVNHRSFALTAVAYTALTHLKEAAEQTETMSHTPLHLRLSDGLTRAAVVLVYLEEHNKSDFQYLCTDIIPHMTNVTYSHEVFKRDYTLRTLAMEQIRKMITTMAPTLLHRINQYLPKKIQLAPTFFINHIFPKDDKSQMIIPPQHFLRKNAQYEAYLNGVIDKARAKIEEWLIPLRKQLEFLPPGVEKSLKLLTVRLPDSTTALLDPKEKFLVYVQHGRSEIVSAKDSLDGFVDLCMFDAHIRQYFQDAFADIHFIEENFKRAHLALGSVTRNEDTCEQETNSIYEPLTAPESHAEVAARDRKVQKEFEQKVRADNAEREAERKLQEKEEFNKLKQQQEIARKKQELKDKILTKIPKLDPDNLKLLQDILNKTDLHKYIAEEAIVAFLQDKLELPARPTKSGYLFIIGKHTVSFHHSHNGDGAGTVDNAFFKELHTAFRDLEITASDITKALTAPPAKKVPPSAATPKTNSAGKTTTTMDATSPPIINGVPAKRVADQLPPSPAASVTDKKLKNKKRKKGKKTLQVR